MGGLHDIKKKDWERLLKKNGFVLDRTNKHHVWKHPDGRTIPVANSGVNPCIARRMVKEFHLEGAPFGWSDRIENTEAETKAKPTTQWQEQLQKAQVALAEKEEKSLRDWEQQALEASKRYEEQQREDKPAGEPTGVVASEATAASGETAGHRENEEAAAEPLPTIKKSPETTALKRRGAAVIPQHTGQNNDFTLENLYMNDQRLKKFHEYLCAVVEYYQQNKSLKNFSALAKQYQVKAITQEQFYQSKLDELKPGQKPDRQTSDKIRMMMAEEDLKRRQNMLASFLKAQEEQDAEGGVIEAAEVKMPTLAERIDTFEARFDLLGPVFSTIIGEVYDRFRKEFGESTSDLLGRDSASVRLNPWPYMKDWAECVEFDLTKMVFDKAEPEEVKALLPTWNEKILHGYLTWLYGGNDGRQLKLHFDERGNDGGDNEQLIELLRDQGLLENMLFVKLESWKGVALCAAIYQDAPDVLMVINEDTVKFYTIEDNIWYSAGGDTIINPENNLGFGGYGTRTIVGKCLRQMLNDDNHKAALMEQKNVTKPMRGKLMNDINHYRDIWNMYHEEWEKKRHSTMLDFG